MELISWNDNYTEEIVSLIHLTVNECFPNYYSKEIIRYFEEYHSAKEIRKKAQEGNLILLHDSRGVLACGYLLNDELGGIYVHPKFQGNDYGKIIVEGLLELAKREKLKSIWLSSTIQAVDFYKKFGFKITEKLIDWVDDNYPLEYYNMIKNI